MASKRLSKEQRAAIQAKTNALNKQYRADAAKLKAAGVLSSKVNARKNISRSTRTKINKFRDVVEGKVIAVRAKPDIRAKYDGVLPARGSFLIVDRERSKERAKIARGLVEITRPIERAPRYDYGVPDDLSRTVAKVKMGEEREVILPFKLTDLPALVDRLQTDESLDGLKRTDEFFAFRIDGWASKQSFVSAKEMGDYISRNYAHLFKPGMAKQVIKYLTFVRFKSADGISRLPEGQHTYKLRNARDGRKGPRPNRHDENRRLENQRNRKAKQREKETPEAKAIRLAKQARRSAQNRQRKFED